MKQGLLLKLMGINTPVVALVILILWLSLDTLAADYFSILMKQYHVTPTEAHAMFLHAVHRYLVWASLGALFMAGILSSLLTKKVLKPLAQMTETAGKISAGEYSTRVSAESQDELGQLATAFNQMAQNLERTERLRRDMVSDVAHELRTPLTNIRGYLEALQDGVVAPTQETFGLLLEETLRLVHLVEDLLRLARADAAKTTLAPEAISLPEFIAQVLKRYRFRFAEKNIAVETHISEIPGTIMTDPDKLHQVLENLLKNAWQYSPPGAHISVTAQRVGVHIKFTIVNSGATIAPEDLPFVFERFYRGEKSRSRDYGGTGIGLAIVKSLVESHGGEVGVESSHGSTSFWFTLPDGPPLQSRVP
jgi:two-component system, OmpR family, sensor histidine kinase BaeS